MGASHCIHELFSMIRIPVWSDSSSMIFHAISCLDLYCTVFVDNSQQKPAQYMVHSSVPGYDNGGIAMTTSLTCLKPYLSVSFSLFESMFSRCKNPAKLYPIKYPPKKNRFFPATSSIFLRKSGSARSTCRRRWLVFGWRLHPSIVWAWQSMIICQRSAKSVKYI